jgi:protein TonB
VLQVKNPATLKNVVPLASEARLTTGQKVFATIYPVTAVAATPPRFVEGTIMSVGGPGSDESVFHVSVLIPPDGVGGAVLDEEGLVIGILVWPSIGVRGTPPLAPAPNYRHSVVKIAAAASLLSGGATAPDNRAVADREQLAARARAATCLVFGPGGPGGVIGGVAGGIVGGFPSGPPFPPPPPPPPAPVQVGGNIKAPRQLRRVTPVYPADARAADVQGNVIIAATVGPDGHVSEARVIRSIPLLDQAALDAVRQWIYEPTIVNGRPVSVIMTVTLNFSLQ